MPHVPAGEYEDKILGKRVTYGDFDVLLIECKACKGVFTPSAEEEHLKTVFHNAHKAS